MSLENFQVFLTVSSFICKTLNSCSGQICEKSSIFQKCFAEFFGSIAAVFSQLDADVLKQTSTAAAHSEPFAFYSAAGSVKMSSCHFVSWRPDPASEQGYVAYVLAAVISE